MEPDDFSARRTYPGTEGGPFEILLRITQPLTSFRWSGVLLFLLVIQFFILLVQPRRLVLPFLLADWGLLAALPKAGRSFGPNQPTTLLLALFRLPFALLPGSWWWVWQLLGSFLVFYGFWIEPQRLTVTHEKLNISTWREDQKVRLVHFGDLHLERWGSMEERLLKQIHSLNPDLILFSGDFLSFSHVFDRAAWQQIRRFFSRLSAPLGVFVVSGSPPVDPEKVLGEMLDGLPLRWLRDEKVRIQSSSSAFNLIGLSCSHRPSVDGDHLKDIELDDEAFTILLYHSPDLAPVASSLGVDLQLSGHTHGGQVTFFGKALWTPPGSGEFVSGEYQTDICPLYVSKGIGMSILPIRFWARPEIVAYTL